MQNVANHEKYMVGADVFLMSSRQDPYPCVVQEAMASALPVITFAGSGGTTEMVAGGGGVVCPYGDIEAVAKAIFVYSKNSEKCLTDGQAGQAIASQMSFAEYYQFIRQLFVRPSACLNVTVAATELAKKLNI